MSDETNAQDVYFHPRVSSDGFPGGWTVSRNEHLPDVRFRITEYRWPDIVLCFVDADGFSADERQAAYKAFRESGLHEGN